MQFLLFLFMQISMKSSVFYGKLAGGTHTRVPPEESDDSWLSNSGGSDEDYVPKPGDEESSSESNRSSSDEEVQDQDASTSAQAARKTSAASTQRKKGKVVWKTVKQSQSSAKNVPVWQGALPDSDSIRLPIYYFRQFFDTELLDVIVKQSNLYCTQQNPNHALKLDQKELEQFIGTVVPTTASISGRRNTTTDSSFTSWTWWLSTAGCSIGVIVTL